jgi:hypothetical protein
VIDKTLNPTATSPKHLLKWIARKLSTRGMIAEISDYCNQTAKTVITSVAPVRTVENQTRGAFSDGALGARM